MARQPFLQIGLNFQNLFRNVFVTIEERTDHDALKRIPVRLRLPLIGNVILVHIGVRGRLAPTFILHHSYFYSSLVFCNFASRALRNWANSGVERTLSSQSSSRRSSGWGSERTVRAFRMSSIDSWLRPKIE